MQVEFRRKLYKRGSSYETTIPLPLLFEVDADSHNTVFAFSLNKEKWYIYFEKALKKQARKRPGLLKRKLYTRGSSFETTIPMPLLFKLQLEKKKYEVVFKLEEGKWQIDFAEVKK